MLIFSGFCPILNPQGCKDSPQYIKIPDNLIILTEDKNQKIINSETFDYITLNLHNNSWMPARMGCFTHNNKLIQALLNYSGKFEEAKLPSNGGSKRRMRRKSRKSRKYS